MRIVRECDSIKGDVKGIREVCQLVPRSDGQRGDVKSFGEV